MNSLIVKKIKENLARKNAEFYVNGINKKTGTKFDEDGYNMYGFSGSKDKGNDFAGYNNRGFDKDGICKQTNKPWDLNGFDFFGINIYTNNIYDVHGKDVQNNQIETEELDKKTDIFVNSKDELNLEKIDDNSKLDESNKDIINAKRKTDKKIINLYGNILQNKLRYLKIEEMNLEKETINTTRTINGLIEKNDKSSKIERIIKKSEKLASIQVRDAIVQNNLDAYTEIYDDLKSKEDDYNKKD